MTRVRHQGYGICGQIDRHFHALPARLSGNEIDRLAHQVIEPDEGENSLGRASERQQCFQDAIDPVDLLQDALSVLARRVLLGKG